MLLSIIVPYYNALPYFEEMIDSLMQQITEEVEVIFINDGSSDGSEKLLIQYSYLPNVKNITVAHGGVSAARNVGVGMCEGMYIWYMDSDDIVSSGAIEYIIASIKKHEYCPDILFANLAVFNNISPRKYYPAIYPFDEYLNRIVKLEDPFDFLYKSCQICSMMGHCIVRKKFLIDNNISFIEQVTLGETLLYKIDVILKANKFAFIDKIIYSYRMPGELHKSLSLTMPPVDTFIHLTMEFEKRFYIFYNEYNPQSGKEYMLSFLAELVYTYANCVMGIRKYESIYEIEKENVIKISSYNNIIKYYDPNNPIVYRKK